MKKVLRRLLGLRQTVSVLCALLMVLSMSCACAQEVPELLEPVGVKLDMEQARIGEISEITLYNGAVTPYVEELYLSVAGVVKDIHFVIGQEVKAGDLLLTLDSEAQEKQIESLNRQLESLRSDDAFAREIAQIDMSIHEVELQRLMGQSPRDEQAIALKNLDIEAFELEVRLQEELRMMEISRLESELAALDSELAQGELYAPFDGRVIFSNGIRRDGYLNAYTPLCYLADDTRLTVETEYILEYRMKNALIYAQVGDQRYDLIYQPISTEDRVTKTLAGETLMSEFEVVGDMSELHSGQYAAVFVEKNYVPDALIIPTNAVYRDSSNSAYVYVHEDGKRVRRNVKTGVTTDWQTQILEGLQEGEFVYVQE